MKSDLGSATAAISTSFDLPLTGNYPTFDNPANGDTLSVLFQPSIYVANLQPIDVGNGTSFGTIVKTLNIVGEAQPSIGSHLTAIEAKFSAPIITVQNMWRTDVGGGGPFLVSPYVATAWQGTGEFIGGIYATSGGTVGDAIFADDVEILQSFNAFGRIEFENVYLEGTGPNTVKLPGAMFVLQNEFDQVGRLWGPGSINMTNGSQFDIDGVTAVSGLLLTGGIKLDSLTTGFPWIAASHTYGPSATVTPAAIDATSMQNPLTGSRYFTF